MERTEGVVLTAKQKREIKRDRQRIYRVVERLDFSKIYEASPVEILEGYTVCDSETHRCFAVFRIQNTCGRDILSLNVRLLCYDGANIPSLKIPFNYSADMRSLGIREYKPDEGKTSGPVDKFLSYFGLKPKSYPKAVRHGEVFGGAVFIPLPGNYSRKIELEILSVVYSDGETQSVNIISGKKYRHFSELNDDLRYAYDKVNIYLKAEEEHPIRIIPQSGENVWLCCCGAKNLNTESKCSRCARERGWQFSNITEGLLTEEYARIKSSDSPDFVHRTKAKAPPRLVIESEEERRQKIEAFEKALENVAKKELEDEHKKRMIVPKILLYFAIMYGIIFLIKFLIDR